uniref:Uncharacterized protein n=1 Tax=Lygus hesperus TaxID=30085 RepID=A0A146M569_LYGHE
MKSPSDIVFEDSLTFDSTCGCFSEALRVYNKLQRPHGTLSYVEKEKALCAVLLRSYDATLRHALIETSAVGRTTNLTPSLSQVCRSVAAHQFSQYMSCVQQHQFVSPNVRHALAAQMLCVYAVLSDCALHQNKSVQAQHKQENNSNSNSNEKY